MLVRFGKLSRRTAKIAENEAERDGQRHRRGESVPIGIFHRRPIHAPGKRFPINDGLQYSSERLIPLPDEKIANRGRHVRCTDQPHDHVRGGTAYCESDHIWRERRQNDHDRTEKEKEPLKKRVVEPRFPNLAGSERRIHR